MSAATLTPIQIEALRPLLEAADAPRFVLIGAAALSVHVPLDRTTNDIDLVFVAAPSEYEPWFERHGGAVRGPWCIAGSATPSTWTFFRRRRRSFVQDR